MKILYLSCHAILEYDEVKLLTELGHEVYSHGVYRDPKGAYTLPRPGVEGMPFDQNFFDLTALHPKTNLPPELIEPYDAIIIMSGEQEAPVLNNWQKIKHKRVILRMIGQSTAALEYRLKPLKEEGLQIVRYSPKEENLPNFAGSDALIRFYKDPEEFGNWTGEIEAPLNFSQSLKGRGIFCHHDQIMGSMVGFEGAKVYGNGNSDLGSMNGGEMPFEVLKEMMRKYRVYVYGGTWPASYTLSFIEAWMTGIPVVAIGKSMAHIPGIESINFYEVDELIENGVTGFICNDVSDMRTKIKYLLDNPLHAKDISEKARAKAIEVFGKERIKAQWAEFLNK